MKLAGTVKADELRSITGCDGEFTLMIEIDAFEGDAKGSDAFLIDFGFVHFADVDGFTVKIVLLFLVNDLELLAAGFFEQANDAEAFGAAIGDGRLGAVV